MLDVAYDWTKSKFAVSVRHIEKFLADFKTGVTKHLKEKTCEVSLSHDQQKVITLLSTQISTIKGGTDGKDCIKRIIVQGKAGTGKSTLIHHMVSIVNKEFQEKNTIIIGAPTGSAALNISGSTIHSLFKIPVKEVGYTPLSDMAKKKLIVELQHCKFIILDEVSLIGTKLLCKVEKRCRELRVRECK